MNPCRAQHRGGEARAGSRDCRTAALRAGLSALLLALAAPLATAPDASAGPAGDERPAASARLVTAAIAAAHQETLLRRHEPGSARHHAATHRALALRWLLAAARRDALLPEIVAPGDPLAPALAVRSESLVRALATPPLPAASAVAVPDGSPVPPLPDIAARSRPETTPQAHPSPAPLHWDSPTRPTVPLSARDGAILPGDGPVLRAWGEPGPDGEPVRGLELALAPGAPVLAPLDGTVRYAGHFDGIGPILIIAHAGGYHSLIAGIGRIDVQPGQEVLAGEPVATMRSPGRLQDPAATLYYELRFQGRPIPPISGLAAAQRRGRG